MYIWHLGNQLRFGTNAGSSTTSAMYVQNGQPSDGLAYGKVVMNSAVLAGTDNPINSSRVSIVDTTRPLVLGYDGSNYTDFEINSAGGLTVDSPHTINLDAARHFEIRAGSGRDVRFMFNGTERASIIESSSMARMGINVTSPPASLAIAGDGTKEEGLMMSGDDGTQYLSLYVDAANPSRYFKLQHNSSYGGIQILDSAGNRDGYFYADANGPGLAASNGYTGLQVGAGAGGAAANTITHIYGKVGVGTSSPDSLLEITTAAATDHLKLTSEGSTANPIKLIFEKSTSEQGIIEYNRNGDLELYNTDNDGGVMIDGSASAGGDFYVSHAGNVGIGTTSPSYPLQVMGEIALGVAGNSYTGDRIKGDTGKIKFTANGGVQATLDGTGLGLGTTSPSAKLDVRGTTLLSGTATIKGATSGTGPKLFFDNPDASGDVELTQGDSGWFQIDSPNDITLDAHTGLFNFKDGGTEFFRIGEDGSSNTFLQAKVDAKDIIFKQYDGDEVIRLTDAKNLDLPSNNAILFDNTNDNNQSFIRNGGTNAVNMQFGLGTPDNANVKMILHGDGKIGIGTTSPTAKLEVTSPTNSYEQARFQWDASNYLGVFVNSGGDSQLEAKTGHLTFKTDTSAHNVRVDSKGDFRVDLGDSNGGYTMRVRAADSSPVFMAKSNGLIGMGTESPAAGVHISSTETSQLRITSGSNTQCDFKVSQYGGLVLDVNHTLEFDVTRHMDYKVGSSRLHRFHVGGTQTLQHQLESGGGLLDFKGTQGKIWHAATPVAQIKDDVGIIMEDNQGIRNHVQTLATWALDAATGNGQTTIQGFSKIQNINTAGIPAPELGAFSALQVVLPSATAGDEFIVVFGSSQSNLTGKNVVLKANGSETINSGSSTGNVTYSKNTGESIHVVCYETGKWTVVSHV